MYIEVQIVRNK